MIAPRIRPRQRTFLCNGLKDLHRKSYFKQHWYYLLKEVKDAISQTIKLNKQIVMQKIKKTGKKLLTRPCLVGLQLT